MNRTYAWLRSALHDRRVVVAAGLAGIVVVASAAGAAYVLTRDGGGKPIVPTEFAVSPEGDEVGRLEPIRVAFALPPDEREGEAILSVEPAIDGDFAWLNDRTLLFQPAYPGFLRGFDYTVSVKAQPQAGLEQDYRASFRTAGKLEIVTTVPANGDKDVPEAAQILVQFNRSVAPLTLLSARSTAPVLQISPPLEGTGEWLNTSLYRFVPKALAPYTEYTVTVAAGLSSAADGVLVDDYSWTFTSFSPALISVTPDRQTQYAGPRQAVTLVFNQPMDRAKVEAAFVFTDQSASVPGSKSWDAAGTTMTFTPSRNLAPLESHTIKLPAGLPGINGGTTLYPWESTFRSVGPLTIASTEPRDGATAAGRYGVTLRFSQPVDMNSLEDRVSISGIAAEDIRGPYGDGISAYYSASLKPSTRYTVSIASGVVDVYGQPLAPTRFSFTTEQLQPSVGLAVNNIVGTFSASAEPILYFHSANVSSASFTLWPLTSEEMLLFIGARSYGSPIDPGWEPSQLPLRTWSQAITMLPNEVQISSTSLAGSGPLPKGDYFVRVTGPRTWWQSEFAFSVVDTAIVMKQSYNELLAWVLDYDTGKPVAGATLAAGGAGVLQTSAVTDGDGLATFPLASLSTLTPYQERTQTAVLASGGRYGVGSTNWRQGAEPYGLDMPVEYYPVRYKGHVYTDRPIYRPGETVELKAIVRDDDDARYTVPASSPPIDVVIRDPQGMEILRQRAILNDHGSSGVSLKLGDEASTGDYHVSIEWTPNAGGPQRFWVASTSFRVAEFVRPEFEVTVTTGAAVYANGDTVTATAEAKYFFGGAVPNAAVEWAVLASPARVTNPDYARFSFSDYDYWRSIQTDGAPLRASGGGVTNEQGQFTFQFPAELLAAEGAQEYTIAATVADQSAQAIAGSTTATIYPADRYAGIRPTKWLAISGTPSTVELVTLTKEGATAPGVPVSVEIYKRRWVTTKVQTAEGGRQYRSEPVDELMTTLNATTNASGEATATFTAPSPGTLRIVAVVTDSAGRKARSATYMWVGGPEAASWRVSNDDLIELVADRDEYAPGDTAKILVPAPFTNAIGLVTVERGKIHSREVRPFASNAETIEIPLDDRSVPNVFVSVVLYRAPTAQDPIPRYKVGYANLAVSTESRKLNVSITPDVAQAQPGQTVNYTVRVSDWKGKGVQSEVSIAVVDKAVLALHEERSIDGLRAFWFERGLGVRTSSSLAVSVNRSNDALPAPAGGGKGGGGFDEEQMRQEFRNTAYWAAQVQTDASGVARVSVPLPDNLTTWRFQARAISGDILVGESTHELLSTRPLLLRPALPRFLRVGDEVRLRLLVRNATDKSTTATVGIEAKGVTLRESDDRRITIAAGASETVEWRASVLEAGTATIAFRGTATNGTQDGVRIELPVYLDVTPESTATNGVVTGDPALEAVYLPEYAIVEGGSLEISVQPTLVGAVASEMAAFRREPWYNESSLDVATRLLASSAILRATGGAGSTGAVDPSSIRSDVADLLNRQRPDGGWAWCTKGCRSDPRLTAWALLALGEAKRATIEIDPSSVSRAEAILVGEIHRIAGVSSPVDPNERAFYLYALAVAGRGEKHRATMNALFEQYRAKLTPSGMAYLLLALNDAGVGRAEPYVGQLLNDLVTSVEPSANGNHWEDPKDEDRYGYGPSPSETTALVLTALSRVQPGHPLIEETVRWLNVSRSTHRWEGKSERAAAVLALAEFAVSTGELGADVGYEVKAAGNEVLGGKFAKANPAAVDAISVPLASLKKGEVSLIEFVRSVAEAGRLYYKLDLRYLTPAADVEALNRGFAVAHEYSALADPEQSIDSAEIGSIVRVKVTVITTQERNYVLVRDFLPAGLEPIDPGLDTTDPALIARLELERRKLAADGGFVPPYFAPWYRWYYNPWKQTDIRDDRMELRTDSLPAGVYEYVYYARATAPGTYFVAPTHAEEGLFPEVFGRSDSGVFTVK